MTQRLLALDFGGTKLAAARIDVDDNADEVDGKNGDADVVAVRRAPTPPDASSSRELMWRLADGVAEGAAVDAVGVSFGGPVDATRGVVRRSLHVRGWDDYPLARTVSQRYGVPCAVHNDANAGALGEQRWGAGRGLADVLYVTVSTGVGAGLVLDGRLHTGAHGSSGELGHLLVSENGPPCSCGRRGCLEAIASGPSIARAARDALRARPGHGDLLRAGVDADPDRPDAAEDAEPDARAVAAAAQRGDDVALAVLAEAGRALGIGLSAVVIVCDPAAIVLGGGVIKSGEPLLGPAREVLRERAFAEPPQLLTSAFDFEAPLYGAAAAAADAVAPVVDRAVRRLRATASPAPSPRNHQTGAEYR
jgi:glucokinase